MTYPWPGNVRELDHVVQRGVLMAQGEVICPDDLALRPLQRDARHLELMTLDEVEVVLIKKALSRFDGNVKQAAKALGLTRSSLYRRLDKYGLADSE